MRTADSIEETKAAKLKSSEQAEKKPDGRGKHGHPNSLKNLKPFPKGFSGNPSGLPGYDVAAALARAVIEENKELIYNGLSKAAASGNAYVFKELAERGYGKLKESREITHIHGEVKDADLDKRISELLADLGLARAIDEVGRTQELSGRTAKANGKAKTQDVLS